MTDGQLRNKSLIKKRILKLNSFLIVLALNNTFESILVYSLCLKQCVLFVAFVFETSFTN